MNKVALFLNGHPPSECPDIEIGSMVVCVDGAYQYLKRWKLIPNFLLGDMDSVRNIEEVPLDTKIIQMSDQNHTDFEKALIFLLSKDVKEINVYASSGFQQDHFLGNLNIAAKYKNHFKLQFFDNHGTYFFLNNQNYLYDVEDKIISLIPFPSAEKVITEGLAYPLEERDLNIAYDISVRNKATQNKISISFERGNLIVFILDN